MILPVPSRFYYQAYTRSNAGGSEKLTIDGSPQWCVRYSPRTTGSFQVVVTITNTSGTFPLKTDSFQVSQVCGKCWVTPHGLKNECTNFIYFKSASSGFIKSSSNKVHFQFTDGRYAYVDVI